MRARIGLVLLLVLSVTTAIHAQDAAKKPAGALGDCVAIDAASGVLTIKTGVGTEAKAKLSATTEYLLIEPGKKTLEGAERITLSDVRVGDRVWARGEVAGTEVAARQIVVMSAQAIAERNQRDAHDWQTRGVMGEVKTVDPATGNVTIETYRGETIAVDTTTATTFRRLETGATDLSRSQAIGLGDLKPGNQVAVRGDRSNPPGRMSGETLIAGDFPRPVRGRIVAVDSKQHTLSIAGFDGAPRSFALPETAAIRKLTPPAAKPADAPASPPPGAGAPRGPRGFAFALGDRSELERRTTAIDVAELKPGDFVFVVAEHGSAADQAVKILVKFDIPTDRPARQQGAPSIGDAGMGDLPF